MGYYAKIESNVVTKVIVADSASYCNSRYGGAWIETKKDGSIRNRYAGVGDTYDSSADVFYVAKPHASWTLDGSYNWNPPTAVPDDWNPGVKDYIWNESNRQWEEP